MLVKAQRSAFFYANRSVVVEGEFCHVWSDILFVYFKFAIAILRTVTTVWHQLNEGSLGGDTCEPVGMVPFRALKSSQNQSACSAAVFMAQPCGPPVHSLVSLPVWKPHSQVPHAFVSTFLCILEYRPHMHKKLTFLSVSSNSFWSGRSG